MTNFSKSLSLLSTTLFFKIFRLYLDMRKNSQERIQVIAELFDINRKKLEEKNFTDEELQEILLSLKADQLSGKPLLCDKNIFTQIIAVS